MIIYKITNKINNKIYIGQTIQTLKARLKAHERGNGKLVLAMIKYGSENFIIEQIDSATNTEELNKKEIEWISRLDCIRNGYNIKVGGNVNSGINNPMYGRKLSPSHIKNISDSLKGRFFSEEHREKLREIAKQRSNLGVMARQVFCINNNTTYESINDAAKKLNLDPSKICKVCKGKMKHTKQHIFEYR